MIVTDVTIWEVLLKSKAIYLSQLREIDTKMGKVKNQLDSFSKTDPENPKKDKMRKRFENLEKKKSKILINFDFSLRSYIERLEDRYHDSSVLHFQDAFCPGCHIKLPTKEANLLRSPDEFIICSCCGRIVVSRPLN